MIIILGTISKSILTTAQKAMDHYCKPKLITRLPLNLIFTPKLFFFYFLRKISVFFFKKKKKESKLKSFLQVQIRKHSMRWSCRLNGPVPLCKHAFSHKQIPSGNGFPDPNHRFLSPHLTSLQSYTSCGAGIKSNAVLAWASWGKCDLAKSSTREACLYYLIRNSYYWLLKAQLLMIFSHTTYNWHSSVPVEQWSPTWCPQATTQQGD